MGLPHTRHLGITLDHPAFASPGAHELEQMQLILETIPVIREEDKDELLKVMPSFVNSTWEVKRPLRKLLPEVNSEGTCLLGAGPGSVLPEGPIMVLSIAVRPPGSQHLLGLLPDD